MSDLDGYGYWIGLNDLANQMTFFWSDGSPVAYTNWAAREPNNYGKGNEDCVLILRTVGQVIMQCLSQACLV